MHTEIEHAVLQFENGSITRRQLVGRLAALAFGMAAAGPQAFAQAPSTFQANGLNHIALNTPDVAVSRDFYVKHLGMKIMRDSESSCFLSCGNDFLALFRSQESGHHHFCYSVDGFDVTKAEELLKGQTLNPNRQGDRICFDDSHGISVQIAATDHTV
jgi:catechol-2,3-dioxygenase